MTTGLIQTEQDLEKQIEKHMAGGCMAGFFNLFDRNHILSSHHGHNRRLYAPKRLLPSNNRQNLSSSPAVDSASESVSSVGSPSSRFKDFDNKAPQSPRSPPPLRSAAPSTTPDKYTSEKNPKASSAVSSSFKGGEEPVAVSSIGSAKVSPWKFTREAPRLSLDSRAVIDAKGKLHPREIRTKTSSSMSADRRQSSAGCTADYDDEESERQRRSPSVIARLMGLDPLSLPSHSSSTSSDCVPNTPGDRMSELRRSASESRSRDPHLQCRFDENGNHNISTGYQSNYTANFNVTTARVNRGFVESASNCRANTTTTTTTRLFDSSGASQNMAHAQQHHLPSSVAAPAARQNHTQRTKSSSSPQQHSHNYHNHNQQHMTRKGFYDSGDFFPDPKQQPAGAPTSGGIEKRLRMRGIEEASKDLETLKQILDALQLKGLLHHSPLEQQQHQGGGRPPFLNDRAAGSASIVVMKSGRSVPELDGLRARTAVTRRNLSCDTTTTVASPRLARSPGRSPRSPSRSEKVGVVSTSAATRRSPGGVESGRRGTVVVDQQQQQQQQRRRGGSSPVQSPRLLVGSGRRMDQNSRSPRCSPRRRCAEMVQSGCEKSRRGEEEESNSTVSEGSCFSTSTDTERSKIEEYNKDGKSILERCDKLLHSIAEMNSATMSTSSSSSGNKKKSNNNKHSSSGELQPSPVSVLDPSFYKEEEESPSPVKKRTIYFTDQQVVELDEEAWSSPSSSSALPPSALSLLKSSDEDDNPELAYISDILRASDYFPEDSSSDLFLLLEKHHQTLSKGGVGAVGRDNSTGSCRLTRRLLFDATTEILNRNRHLPPWKSCSFPQGSATEIWSEIQRMIRSSQRDSSSGCSSDDLLEEICGVMKRDMVQNDSIQGWNGSHMEVSDAVLDIERLIFKDLIGETIRDLATTFSSSGGEEVWSVPRRKLVF